MGARRVYAGCFCFTTLVLILTPSFALAQLNRGAIEGTVTDTQGGVLVEAQVDVISIDTGVTTRTTTNSAGFYRAADLIPGKYRVHVSMSGFSVLDVNDIDVLAGEPIRVDVKLNLGTTHQAVEVTADATMLETSAVNSSTTLEQQMVQEIPLQGRDLQQLIFLTPGVSSVGGPPGSNFGFNSAYGGFPDPTHVFGSDLSVNGGQGGANAWYLDGNLNISGFAENVVVNPSPDAVQEFQVITSALSAEYGRTGGGVFNVVLKSGSNAFHGNIYEYVRNSVFNARNPFTSIDASGNIIPQDQLRYNDFGGTLGGPVIIPHFYNGRNRTFFFVSWDTSILHLSGNQIFTVPTELMRQGNFSEDPNTAQYGLWDPYTTNGPNAQGIYDRTAFGTPAPGNPNGCLASQIAASGGTSCTFATSLPTGRLDPIAMYFINSYPQPNYLDPLSNCPLAAGGGTRICQNFRGTVGNAQDTDNLSIKVDHRLSDRNAFFGEWLYSPTNYTDNRVPWTGPTFPEGLVGFESKVPYDFQSQVVALGNTFTVSPTLINEFRASYTRQFLNTHPGHPFANNLSDQAGVEQELAPIGIPTTSTYPVPAWSINMPSGPGLTFGTAAWDNLLQSAEAYTILDNVTKVLGRHTIKMGFVYRLEHSNWESAFPTGLSFTGGISTDPISGIGGGSGLEQFMLGAVANDGNSYFGAPANEYMSNPYMGAYAQDDFHINSQFSLDFGVRYEIFSWFKDRYPYSSNFCLTCINSLTGLPGAVVYTDGPGHRILPANKNDFSPRINFAWTPFADRKTVVRGGYDIFYSDAADIPNDGGQGGALSEPGWEEGSAWQGSIAPGQCPSFTGQCVAWELDDTVTNKVSIGNPPSTELPALTHSSLLGSGAFSFQKPAHDPMIQSWNLEVQRQLPHNLLVSIGYVGTHGTHLLGSLFQPYNFVPTPDLLQYESGINAAVPIASLYSGTAVSALSSIYGGSTAPLSDLVRPFPAFPGGINAAPAGFNGTTDYNSMVIRVQERLSNGLNLVSGYTISKKIDNCLVAELGSIVVNPVNGTSNVGGRSAALGAQNGGFCQNLDDIDVDRAVAPDDIPQLFNLAATYQLPVGKGRAFLSKSKAGNAVLGGWMISETFNAESGVPLPISGPCDSLQTFTQNGTNCRVDLVGSPDFGSGRTQAEKIAQWVNPSAFQPSFGPDQTFWANYDPADPRAWQFGTMGPRLANFRAPGFWDLDMALSKQFPITESKYLQFRWEILNALNHQNLALPNTSFCLPANPDGSTDLVHQAGCSFGRITNIQTDPRSMEFALKLFW